MAYLIIDHDKASGLLTRTLLEQMKLDIITAPLILIARTGHEALERLAVTDPDSRDHPGLIILDADFSDIPGIELCMKIRSERHYDNTPVIVTSGKEDRKIMRDYFGAGANDFIFKPLNKTEFHARAKLSVLASQFEKIRNQRQAELESMNRKLEEKNKTIQEQQAKIIYQGKLGALSRVAAGIAHEINNPLSYVYGNVDYIKTWLFALRDLLGALHPHIREDQGLSDTIEKINLQDLESAIESAIDGSLRIREIIHHFKDLSYYDEKHLGNLHLSDLLTECASTLQSQFPQVNVQDNIRPVPVFFGNRKVFYSALWNVMINAYEAIAEAQQQGILPMDRGTVRIDVFHEAESPEEWIVIQISDNGIGIPSELQDKLFEPFFTTKQRMKNFGLGLYEVYNILQPYQGLVQIRSVHREGTEITIRIPVQENRFSPEHELPSV